MIKVLLIGTLMATTSSNIVPAISIMPDHDDGNVATEPIPYDSRLGNCKKVKEKIIEQDSHKINGAYDANRSSVYSSARFRNLYKYSNTASIVVKDLDTEFHALTKDSSITINESYTVSSSNSYTEQVSTTLTKTFGKSLNVGANVGYCKIEAEVSSSTPVSAEFGYQISETYSKSATNGLSITYVADEYGLYRLERRALFDISMDNIINSKTVKTIDLNANGCNNLLRTLEQPSEICFANDKIIDEAVLNDAKRQEFIQTNALYIILLGSIFVFICLYQIIKNEISTYRKLKEKNYDRFNGILTLSFSKVFVYLFIILLLVIFKVFIAKLLV